MKQVMRDVQESARSAMTTARQKAATTLDAQREVACDRLACVAQAMRNTADELHSRKETAVADLAERAAGGVDRISEYLRRNNLSSALHDAEHIARQHPAVCLGSAFLVGAMLGRFLHASQRHPSNSGFDGRSSTGEPLTAYHAQAEYAPAGPPPVYATAAAGSIAATPSRESKKSMRDESYSDE